MYCVISKIGERLHNLFKLIIYTKILFVLFVRKNRTIYSLKIKINQKAYDIYFIAFRLPFDPMVLLVFSLTDLRIQF